ncbi:MAG: type II toxin-antitoxin system HigB family toxin [Terriglobia bacterium]|jgi:mRNA interferase HigB
MGTYTVLNIGGNKFRLIATIKYKWQVVYIRQILTHAEYDEGVWL